MSSITFKSMIFSKELVASWLPYGPMTLKWKTYSCWDISHFSRIHQITPRSGISGRTGEAVAIPSWWRGAGTKSVPSGVRWVPTHSQGSGDIPLPQGPVASLCGVAMTFFEYISGLLQPTELFRSVSCHQPKPNPPLKIPGPSYKHWACMRAAWTKAYYLHSEILPMVSHHWHMPLLTTLDSSVDWALGSQFWQPGFKMLWQVVRDPPGRDGLWSVTAAMASWSWWGVGHVWVCGH